MELISNINRLRLTFIVIAVFCVGVFAWSATPAHASAASSCTNYSYAHGGGGCVWQNLYRDRYGMCSVLRAYNGAVWFGQIWSMTAPCTEG